MPSPESVPIFLPVSKIIRFHYEKLKSVKGLSCFEKRTQLLTFWKDMVVYELIYHIILQNRRETEKVDGDDSYRKW